MRKLVALMFPQDSYEQTRRESKKDLKYGARERKATRVKTMPLFQVDNPIAPF
jgi:hypothetical protein